MKLVFFNSFKIFISKLILFKLSLIFSIYSRVSLTECSKDKPFLKDGKCFNRFESNCTFDTCLIGNKTVKTQLLNNVIKAGGKDSRYVSFASNQNGDLIFSTFSFPKSTKRIFYGIKSDGRPLFKNKINEECYSKILNSTNNSLFSYEYESLIIKLSGNNNTCKEYLLTVGKSKSNAEIYDFDNNEIYDKDIASFAKNQEVASFRNLAIFFYSEGNNYYYLFGFILKINSTLKYCLQTHRFSSLNDFKQNYTVVNGKCVDESINKKTGISCYITINKCIICAFLNKNKNYKIVALNETFDVLNGNTLEFQNQITEFDNPFYKAIHIHEEIGAFFHFEKNSQIKVRMRFLKYDLNKITINLNATLELISFNNLQILANDLIKLNKNKLCFVNAGDRNKTINIILISLYANYGKVTTRYYSIKIYDLYGYIFHKDIKMHNYKNFISLAFSYCLSENCQNDFNDAHFSAFMILGYPNSTDNTSNLYQFLLDNNNLTINDFYINLTQYILIENNLFGYIFSGVVILDIINYNDEPKLISSKSPNQISVNYSLEEDEIIKLKFNQSDYYNSFNYSIKYIYKVTEPNISIYNQYPETMWKAGTVNDFNISEYFGKISYHNIYLEKDLTETCEDFNCSLCLSNRQNYCISCINENFTINDLTKEKICSEIINEEELEIEYLYQGKENIKNIIEDIINSIEIGKHYKMIGNDFIMLIRPINSDFINSSARVNFSTCEDILRTYYNISKDSIITFIQVEINNTNEHSLINQVEYEAYDDKRQKLNLSICNDATIQILYSIIPNSSLNISSINSFKDLNIDILNLKDKFFNDICMSYSSSDKDVTLSDRIIDFYQNYSLCDENCLFDEIDLISMTISCNCSVKTNLKITEPSLKLQQLEDVEKALAFGIIKCYNLAFSWKDKKNNIGFWLFCFFETSHITSFIIYFCKGIETVKDYIFNQIKECQHIKTNNNLNENQNKIIKRKRPLKKSKIKINKAAPQKRKENKNKNLKGDKSNDNSSINKMKTSYRDIIPKSKSAIYKKEKKISIATTQEGGTKKKYSSKETKIINLNLININLNNNTLINLDSLSNYILNIYTFEQAIKKDFRQLCTIFYIYLLTKQAIFHAFLYKSPLVLFPLRFCLLIFIISSDFALNALFYFDDKISERYRYTKNILLFALTKNVSIILLSTFIGFIFLTLCTKLSTSINDIKEVFIKEEQLVKKDKNQQIDENRIKKGIEDILKKYKIKVIILVVVQNLLLLFFWYYVTIFCHVYYKTQKSWIVDSLLSMIFRIIIDCLLCIFFAKLYRLGVESNILCIYKISLVFYSFG